ncbi:DUF4913 domain-containing protein [Pseudarthrobacter sp. NPDC089323]
MKFDPNSGEVLTPEQEADAENDHGAGAPVPDVDFTLWARDAAELATELLGRRITTAGFRHLVMLGEAPLPIEGTEQWSHKDLMEWADQETASAEATDEGGDGTEDTPPVHADVFDFYDRTFRIYYELHDTTPNALQRERPIMSWCQQWWLHRGVVGRLTAAWYAWESAHADGGSAISAWILEHADRHFDRIMAEDGPLRMCKQEHTDALDVYPAQPVPESLRLPDTDEEGEAQ